MEKNSVYRVRFRSLLMPYLEMLRHKQHDLSQEDWLASVEQVRNSVIKHSDQYLGLDTPSHEIIEQEVSALFNEFIYESKSRNLS